MLFDVEDQFARHFAQFDQMRTFNLVKLSQKCCLHCDEEVANDVEVEVTKINHERREKKEASVATMRKDLGFLLREYEFQNKCIKYNGLHRNLREKAKTFKGTLLPRDMPSRELYPGFAEPWRDRTNPQERRFERPKGDEKKRTENPNGSAVEVDGKE